MTPGFGSIDRRCARTVKRRVVVQLDDLQMAEVRARAIASKQSLAATVRELLEWGLESAA